VTVYLLKADKLFTLYLHHFQLKLKVIITLVKAAIVRKKYYLNVEKPYQEHLPLLALNNSRIPLLNWA
jgi:hypothetical protein